MMPFKVEDASMSIDSKFCEPCGADARFEGKWLEDDGGLVSFGWSGKVEESTREVGDMSIGWVRMGWLKETPAHSSRRDILSGVVGMVGCFELVVWLRCAEMVGIWGGVRSEWFWYCIWEGDVEVEEVFWLWPGSQSKARPWSSTAIRVARLVGSALAHC